MHTDEDIEDALLNKQDATPFPMSLIGLDTYGESSDSDAPESETCLQQVDDRPESPPPPTSVPDSCNQNSHPGKDLQNDPNWWTQLPHLPPGLRSAGAEDPTSDQQPSRPGLLRQDILPPKDTPPNVQVQIFAYQWAAWAATIENDQRREEVLGWIFRTAEGAWRDGLFGNEAGKPTTKRRGRRGINETNPVVIVSKSHKNSDRYAIRQAELKFNGLSMDDIYLRIAQRELDPNLLPKTRHTLDRPLSLNDCMNAAERCPENPMGRDLMLYAVFEYGQSEKDLAKLRNLYQTFGQERQRKNTVDRIRQEGERRDVFLALAIELHQRRAEADNEEEEEDSIDSEDISSDDGEIAGHGPESPVMVADDLDISTKDIPSIENQIWDPAKGHNAAGGARNENDAELDFSERPAAVDLDDAEQHTTPKNPKLRHGDRPEKPIEATGHDSEPQPQLRIRHTGPPQPPHPSSTSALPPHDATSSHLNLPLSKKTQIITLRLPHPFNPIEYSSTTINSLRDFHFRYFSDSTLSQRRAMDDVVGIYVQTHRANGTRFGTYQILTHRDDDLRRDLVHGYWMTSRGARPKGSEWFWEGLERPPVAVFEGRIGLKKRARGRGEREDATDEEYDDDVDVDETTRVNRSRVSAKRRGLPSTRELGSEPGPKQHAKISLKLRRDGVGQGFHVVEDEEGMNTGRRKRIRHSVPDDDEE